MELGLSATRAPARIKFGPARIKFGGAGGAGDVAGLFILRASHVESSTVRHHQSSSPLRRGGPIQGEPIGTSSSFSQVHRPNAHAPLPRRRRHRQPSSPLRRCYWDCPPQSSVRPSWGARVAGDFVSRGRSAVPAHHVSGIPRCGINGSYRWWSSHRPGPGASQPPCLSNHVWRYWTGPGLHRGETESLADPPHTPSPRQGKSRWSTARLSMALQHPRGSFSVR